ncbi:uncharacterized protein LOC118406020 [Branchiostoma floridae]|uniref:Uncharacterized protein LOC118406020 n=1 Tax=Branchiostoma floridae TaxID=7739 RepID=A0A9J7KJF3_BRAFL|nr:uncharacterized protein LOC118406020 [Branchiostoma floridae]
MPWSPTEELVLKLRKAKRCKDKTIGELCISVAAGLESVEGLPNKRWYGLGTTQKVRRKKNETFLQVSVSVDGQGMKTDTLNRGRASGPPEGSDSRPRGGGGRNMVLEVLEEEMERTLGVNMKTDFVNCEVPYGGVLFINNAIPHRSLLNKTEQIRWSLDLRWQDTDKPSGFWEKRRPVLMRTAKDGDEVDEFDTTVHGPWLTRWLIGRHNRHTRVPILQKGDI